MLMALKERGRERGRDEGRPPLQLPKSIFFKQALFLDLSLLHELTRSKEREPYMYVYIPTSSSLSSHTSALENKQTAQASNTRIQKQSFAIYITINSNSTLILNYLFIKLALYPERDCYSY